MPQVCRPVTAMVTVCPSEDETDANGSIAGGRPSRRASPLHRTPGASSSSSKALSRARVEPGPEGDGVGDDVSARGTWCDRLVPRSLDRKRSLARRA